MIPLYRQIASRLIRLGAEQRQYGWSEDELRDRARVELAPLFRELGVSENVD